MWKGEGYCYSDNDCASDLKCGERAGDERLPGLIIPTEEGFTG